LSGFLLARHSILTSSLRRTRHCERSEAIQQKTVTGHQKDCPFLEKDCLFREKGGWIASGFALAMTGWGFSPDCRAAIAAPGDVVGLQSRSRHPHGDASIGDALVQLGEKDLLVDRQGNWGNILTGDGAAAPRYIEARLSKFALEVVFNPTTTDCKLSYDGRNKESACYTSKNILLLQLYC
jgi:hypothetical protein